MKKLLLLLLLATSAKAQAVPDCDSVMKEARAQLPGFILINEKHTETYDYYVYARPNGQDYHVVQIVTTSGPAPINKGNFGDMWHGAPVSECMKYGVQRDIWKRVQENMRVRS